MNYSIRIWFMVTLTLAFSSTLIRLAWEIPDATSVASLAIIGLVMLVIIAIDALAIYLLISPSMEKLKSKLVGIWVIGIFTIGFAGSIIHYIRFIPSDRADDPLAKLIASLLILAAISGYVLVLWVFRSVWKGEGA